MDYFIDFAAYEPTSRYIPGAGNISLVRGQWAFTERELSEFFGVDRQRIRTCLKKLKEQPFINPVTNPKFTIVSVINYDTYQSELSNTNPKINHQLTTSKPAPNPKHDSIIIKEIKNKEKDMFARRRQLPPDFILSEKLIQFAKEHGINGNRINDVFEHFKDHHQSKGTTMLDWNKAFMNWVRNDKKFGAKDNFKQGPDIEKWIEQNS